jgi:hypothetical protein
MLPTIQEEVSQPRANTTKDSDLRGNLDQNIRGCDARGYIDQCHHEREERELRCCLDYIHEYVLGPRLPSVAYPDNFKLNIQKYNGRSDPNIWLSTYNVTVKAAGGNLDHMAAYFPLVMGDTPSLWLNNLPAGSIKSWADLSLTFTSNFQATYNRPRNAFNLGRVTIKTGERLRNYTNRFFENRNTCVGIRDDQFVDSYKKGVRDRKVLEKIHESGATTVASLMEVVNKIIDTDEALVNQFDSDAKRDAGTSVAATDLGSKLRKRPFEVLTADGR